VADLRMELGPGPNMAVTMQILTLVATVLVSATLIPGIGAAETKLTKQCLADEFKCRDEQLCVKASAVCDGVHDCHDHSDEEACARDQSCHPPLFKCPNEDPLRCINHHWVCDGHKDCHDGSDEVDCPSSPKSHEPFQVKNGTIYLSSDLRAAIVPKNENFCNQTTEFRCKNGLCIPKELTCDDISDCMDGSDEDQEMCQNQECKDEEFTCQSSGHCIPIRWKCDENPDCPDGSDERNCNLNGEAASDDSCPQGQFDCGKLSGNSTQSVCISMESVCDGSPDCADGSDESLEKCAESCKDLHCVSKCQGMPDGSKGTCICPEGFKLKSDGLECEDINECVEEYGVCSQHCQNTVGSFECSCADDYFMYGTSTCKAKGNFDPILFFSGKSEIRGLNLRTKEAFLVNNERNWTNTAIGIAYDAKNDRVFWTATANHTSRIISSTRNGEDMEEVVTGLVMPESLAVDYVARNIYYSEPAKDHLGVCSLDAVNGTRWCAVLLRKGVRQPREISLHIPKGLLFFTDWAHEMAKIQRVGMDGTHAEAIVTENLHWPNGITVDAVAQRIYWSDAKHDLLESAKFDGSDRRQTKVTVIKHPFSLAVFEDRLFWSDWDLKKIQSCNKVTGQDRDYLFNDTKIEPFGIHIYHPALEPQISNPCESHMCSHLCLLAHGGQTFTCKCPEGMTLGIDERTCQTILKESPPALATDASLPGGKLLSINATSDNLEISENTVYSTSNKTEDIKPKRAPVRPTMSQAMYNERLKVGLAVALVLSVILTGFLIACYRSFKKGTPLSGPILRYHKTSPFGSYQQKFNQQPSEDMNIFVESSSSQENLHNPKNASSNDLTRNLDGAGSWQNANSVKEKDQADEPSSKNVNLKLWRQNTGGNPYYKL